MSQWSLKWAGLLLGWSVLTLWTLAWHPSQSPPAPPPSDKSAQLLYSECGMIRMKHRKTNNPFLHFILGIGLPQHCSHVIVKQELKEETRRRQEDFFLMIHHITVMDPFVSDRWCHNAVMYAEVLWHYSDPPSRPTQYSSCWKAIWVTCFCSYSLCHCICTYRENWNLKVSMPNFGAQLQIIQWMKEQKCII